MEHVTLASAQPLTSPSPNQIFFCPEESQFYAQCLEKLVLRPAAAGATVVEFGSGDGSPVISALLKSDFAGQIHGYELNAAACTLAASQIQRYDLEQQYRVHHQSFFGHQRLLTQAAADCLIANPPYLPAPDDDLYLPALHGGADGATITRRLLTQGCRQVMLMISAYANPVDTIEDAQRLGYRVADFMISPLKFGYYSCEPKVRNTISELQQRRKAFFSENIYFLAGVLFEQRSRAQPNPPDLAAELLKVMTAL